MLIKPQSLPSEFAIALSDDAKVLELASFYPNKWLSFLESWQNKPTIASKLSFTGHIPHTKVVEKYQQADILIFPSVWNEPFGVPIIEAMAVGTPVIATKGGAFPETIEDGKTGLLVERGNVNALAEAIIRLLADEKLSQTIVAQAKEKVDQFFTFDRVAHELITFEYDSQPINLPITINWSENSELDVQDGCWETFKDIQGGRVRPKKGYEGYDRILNLTATFRGNRRVETDLIFRHTSGLGLRCVVNRNYSDTRN